MPLASQFRVFARSLEDAFAYGMHNSVACSEDAPLIDAAKLDLAALNATHMGAEQVQQLIEACQRLAQGRGRRGSARAVQERRGGAAAVGRGRSGHAARIRRASRSAPSPTANT